MTQNGYNKSPYDSCVYHIKVKNGTIIFLVLHVDDMLIAAKEKFDIQKLKGLLRIEFKIKDLGVAHKILSRRSIEIEVKENFSFHIRVIS